MELKKGTTLYVGGKKFKGPCEVPEKYVRMIEEAEKKAEKKAKLGKITKGASIPLDSVKQ